MIGRAELDKLADAAKKCGTLADALELARTFEPGLARAGALREVACSLGRRGRFDLAAQVFAAAAGEQPSNGEHLVTCARALEIAYQPKEAMEVLQRVKPQLSGNRQLLAQMFAVESRCLLSLGRVLEAEAAALQSLSLAPGHPDGREALGSVRYAVGDWRTWLSLTADFELFARGESPLRQALGDLPTWSGRPVKRLVLFGGQGIGDEVRAAMTVAEAAKRAQRVVLECNPRLRNLFARSFPKVEVRGTRGEAAKPWAHGRRFDAMASTELTVAMFGHLRRGEAYLTPDPAARRHWRIEFDRLPRPVIGIAWTGGAPNTGQQRRTIGLTTFAPLIRSTRATFVSLQYRDAAAEIAETGLPVVQYSGATLAADYDKTAALVAELDAILGPPTSVHCLAAALGKASTVLVPSVTNVDFACGDRSPWFLGQRYHRQHDGESWAECVARLDMQAVIGGRA